MKAKSLLLFLFLVPLLSACPGELAAINDRPEISSITITAQPEQAVVGDEVNVTAKATLTVDSRSAFAEIPLSVSMGVCFSEGVDASGIAINVDGFCNPFDNSLSPKYRLLNGSTYFKKFSDVLLRRGEERTFEHSFSFTLDEADEVMLESVGLFETKRYAGFGTSSSFPVNISFKQP